jgi:hypothetical protein
MGPHGAAWVGLAWGRMGLAWGRMGLAWAACGRMGIDLQGPWPQVARTRAHRCSRGKKKQQQASNEHWATTGIASAYQSVVWRLPVGPGSGGGGLHAGRVFGIAWWLLVVCHISGLSRGLRAFLVLGA